MRKRLDGEIQTEEDGWKAILPAVKAWLGNHLTEADAWLLLSFFGTDDESRERPIPLPAIARLERTKRLKVKSKDSLALLALHIYHSLGLQKDVRTLRNWCEEGFVPGAYRTKGGHWRVKLSPRTLRDLAERAGGRFRGQRNLRRSRRWQDFDRKMRPVFTRAVPLLFRLDAELRQAPLDEFSGQPPPAPAESILKKLLAMKQTQPLNDHALDYITLRLAARRLHLAGRRPTAEALATNLGMSRRTLFRRFRNHLVQKAIDQVSNPLSPGEEDEVPTDTLHDQVLQAFETQGIQARPKKNINWKR
jgi:hypothetical protein